MLTTLRIKNLALVADLTLELQPGYNVITGETGAGKSILIGALNLVLGERADRTLIRSGRTVARSRRCSTSSRAARAAEESFLDENGLEPCEDHQLVLKRAFTSAGTNRQFINGSPTTLTTLAAIGEWLVDIHGPHDHQSLLHPAKQLAILDAFGGLETEREAFGELVRRRAALENEKSALVVDEKTYAQQLDLLRFQAQEIAAARLQPDEEAQVEQEFNRASNAAKLLQLSQAALDALSENEPRCSRRPARSAARLQELQRVDAGAANLAELHAQAAGTLRELQAELSHYAEKVDVDPARLPQLEERLNLHPLAQAQIRRDAGRGHRVRRRGEAKAAAARIAATPSWPGSTPSWKSSTRNSGAPAGNFPPRARKSSRSSPRPSASSSPIWVSSKASSMWLELRRLVAECGRDAHVARASRPATRRRASLSRSSQPASTRLNSNSRRTRASRPSRCAPLRPPAKWRA